MTERPLWAWPVVDHALAGAPEHERRIGAALPCFAWRYHDRDDQGAPLAESCPRDGRREPLCPVRGRCAEAWPHARAAELATMRSSVPVEFRPDRAVVHHLKGVSRTETPRRGYISAPRDSDRILYGLMLTLGLPPTLYDRAWFSNSPAAHRWARANLGACFVCAPSSYHSVFAWRDGVQGRPGMYLLAARAWTNTTRRLRVDLMPELATAVMKDEWLKAALQPIQRSMTAREALPGARFRLVLDGVQQGATLGRVMLTTFGLSYEEIVASGATWRGEAGFERDAPPKIEPEPVQDAPVVPMAPRAPVAVDEPVVAGRLGRRR